MGSIPAGVAPAIVSGRRCAASGRRPAGQVAQWRAQRREGATGDRVVETLAGSPRAGLQQPRCGSDRGLAGQPVERRAGTAGSPSQELPRRVGSGGRGRPARGGECCGRRCRSRPRGRPRRSHVRSRGVPPPPERQQADVGGGSGGHGLDGLRPPGEPDRAAGPPRGARRPVRDGRRPDGAGSCLPGRGAGLGAQGQRDSQPHRRGQGTLCRRRPECVLGADGGRA
mmetsp:Transcript_63574/g.200885  ORF Transcript_63574/g.200885 Transcript_63574/m.200885 type:complete len:226 (+) Transcript_63574:226-903(+)